MLELENGKVYFSFFLSDMKTSEICIDISQIEEYFSKEGKDKPDSNALFEYVNLPSETNLHPKELFMNEKYGLTMFFHVNFILNSRRLTKVFFYLKDKNKLLRPKIIGSDNLELYHQEEQEQKAAQVQFTGHLQFIYVSKPYSKKKNYILKQKHPDDTGTASGLMVRNSLVQIDRENLTILEGEKALDSLFEELYSDESQ